MWEIERESKRKKKRMGSFMLKKNYEKIMEEKKRYNYRSATFRKKGIHFGE